MVAGVEHRRRKSEGGEEKEGGCEERESESRGGGYAKAKESVRVQVRRAEGIGLNAEYFSSIFPHIFVRKMSYTIFS